MTAICTSKKVLSTIQQIICKCKHVMMNNMQAMYLPCSKYLAYVCPHHTITYNWKVPFGLSNLFVFARNKCWCLPISKIVVATVTIIININNLVLCFWTSHFFWAVKIVCQVDWNMWQTLWFKTSLIDKDWSYELQQQATVYQMKKAPIHYMLLEIFSGINDW